MPGKRPYSISSRRGIVILLFVGSLTVLLLVFHKQLLTTAGSALVENDGPHAADAILVLGGDGFGTRTLTAAALAQSGYAPYVVLSGPRTLLGAESDTDIEYARRHGYSAALFRPVPNNCMSTRDESVYFGQYFKGQGLKKILLVTSNFHTRRAARLFRNKNPWMQVDVVPAPDPDFGADRWWKSREGLKTFFFEWSKTFATWLGI